MTELQKLMQLLDDLMIAWVPLSDDTVMLSTKPLFITEIKDGLSVLGWGYSNIWTYSAEYVARMLDRKFREEMQNRRV